jgi:hypothetical protein
MAADNGGTKPPVENLPSKNFKKPSGKVRGNGPPKNPPPKK